MSVDAGRGARAPAPPARASTLAWAHVTRERLERASDAFAAALACLELAPGDRLALVLPPCPQLAIAQIGAWKAGAVAVALDPGWSGRELGDALMELGARLVVTLGSLYGRVKEAQASSRVESVIATGAEEYLPPDLRLALRMNGGQADPRVELREGDHRFQELLAEFDQASAPGAPPAVDARAGPGPPPTLRMRLQ